MTAAVAPMNIAACLAGLEMMEAHPELIRQVQENGRYVRERLTAMGFDIGKHETAIIPVFIRDRQKANAIVKEAYERGVFLSPIEYPAVAVGTERIRLTVMATHTRSDLDTALDLVGELGRKYGVIG